MRHFDSAWIRLTGLALLILLPALLVFGPGLYYPFLGLDDLHYIVNNTALRDLSADGVRYLFFEDHRDLRYQPLTYLSFAVDYWLFGLDPYYFHLVNLLLHAANTLMVAMLVRCLTRDDVAAVVTALLFSIHPLQVESVVWVFSRKNLLAQFFFLLAALAYLTYSTARASRPRAAVAALVGSALLYLMACLSRITAITLPVILVLFDSYREPGARPQLFAFLRKSVPSKLLYLPPLIGFFALFLFRVTPNAYAREYEFSAVEWISIVGHNLFFYVAKTLVPIHLGVFYVLPAPGTLPPYFALFTALSVAMIAAAVVAWRRGATGVFVGLGWYLVSVSPLAVILWVFSDLPLFVADRYYYQSSIGLSLICGIGAGALWRRWPNRRRALAVAGALALCVLSVVATQHRRTFRSTVAMYEHLLAHHPSDEFYYRLALLYEEAGQKQDAFAAVEAAERTENKIFFMNFLFHRIRISELHRQRGDFAAAADHLEAGLEAVPNPIEPEGAVDPLAYRYLAELRRLSGDAAAARGAEQTAQSVAPDPGHYFLTRWAVLAPDGSADFLEQLVAREPENGRAWYQRGIYASVTGDKKTATTYFLRARELGYRG